MQTRRIATIVTFVTTLTLLLAVSSTLAGPQERLTADNPNPPASPVKLIFIHHSTGGNWLADPNEDQPYGGLGIALMNNNYYVSATNYEWGPYGIGDRTDIPNWPEWFTGPNRDEILVALYHENSQNFGDFGSWSRLATNPGGENEIIMFKSCFPNSDLWGNPGDPPLSEPNDYEYTVANAKAVYNNILTYFATRQDKLFIVITAPPMGQGEYSQDVQTPAQRAANARAFNNWLVNDWLDSYPYHNVAVFDYYNVLTSNGSATRADDPETNEEPNDAGWADGNHHRWRSGAVDYRKDINNDFSAYPTDTNWDSHPTTAGQQKATTEFVQLLNVFYNRWAGGAVVTPTPTATSPPPTSTPTKTPTPTRTGAPPMYHFVYLPLILRSWSPSPPTATATPTPTPTPTTVIPSGLIQPADLVYQGAFRLPGGDTPPQTFAYGGNAMTFNPDGDPANTDPYPGSLFVMGHDRMAYGDLPDGNQVAEVSIPVPAIADNPADLPQATFIQDFHDVAAGYFTQLEEIPKVGMQYLKHPATGPKIHLCWGQNIQPQDVPSHAWFNATLGTPNLQGVWFIGYQDLHSVNGYMFDIPASWADAHAQGRYLATGRMRDGGQGGMGPTLFAYRPWLPDGSAPPSGTHLEETTLLLYETVYNTPDFVRCLNGYQHADEWEGGAWMTTPSGKTAVLFAGTKSTGAKHWYGFINPLGPEYPCVDQHVTDFDTCRMADGSSCPAEDYAGCCDDEQGTCVTYRGWWSSRWDAQFILYDPAQLAQVAAGEIESWEPQPYASLDIDEHLYLDPPECDEIGVGWGVQRRNRIGAAAYDRENALLYVLELYADGAKPVVHVWEVQ
jgi:hypothetical protein